MQKVVTLLERHVQWLVLALGAVYLLWMVWSYIINPPVIVAVNNTEVAPGDVDVIVRDQKANELKDRLKRGAKIQELAPGDAVQTFTSSIAAAPVATAISPLAFSLPTGKLDSAKATPTQQGNQAVAAAAQMQSLPKPPEPQNLMIRRGRTTALIPDAAGQPDPAAADLGPVVVADRDWVNVRFLIDHNKLKDAFETAKVPQMFMKALFLQTELVRQELQSNGQWGAETVIPKLKNSKAPGFPAEADAGAQFSYNDWARGNQTEILQPAFYKQKENKGDRWLPAGVTDDQPAAAAAAEQFDPARYLDAKADLNGLTPEQKSQVLEARRAAAAERAKQRREQSGGNNNRRPPPEGTGGSRGPGGEGAVIVAQNQPAPLFPGPGFSGGEPAARGVAGAEFSIPNGEFDPRDPTLKDFVGWANDDTAQPGKTYRYKIRYSLKNPAWKTANVVANPADANVFALVSDFSPWTESITVPSLTTFFLAAGFDAGAVRNVRFEVFKYQDGTLHSQLFNVSPGDAIGRSDDGVDFATGWSLVDIRRELRGNGSYVLMTDSSGKLQQRLATADESNAEYKKFKQQLKDQTAASAGG